MRLHEGIYENHSYHLVHAFEPPRTPNSKSTETRARSCFLLEYPLRDLRGIANDAETTSQHVVGLSLRLINLYMRHLALASEDRRIRFLTRSTTSGTASITFTEQETLGKRTFRPFDGSALRRKFDLNPNDEPPLSLEPAEVWRRMEQSLALAGSGHPMDDVVLWQLRAENLGFEIGDYEMAVVALQTSVERLVYGISKAILVDRGKDLMSVTDVESQSFSTTLKNLGHGLGGGAWSVEDDNQPLGKYWRDCYSVRNRVAHGGSTIAEDGFSAAFASYQELRADIERRLLDKKNSLPRTSLMVFGAHGILTRGRMSGKFRAICDLIRQENNPRSFWKHADER